MSLKSVAYGIISFIIVSLLTFCIAGADEPIMPPSVNVLIPNTGTVPSTFPIRLRASSLDDDLGLSQIQILITSVSSGKVYLDHWFNASSKSFHQKLRYETCGTEVTPYFTLPIGETITIYTRGWNNNGFSIWGIGNELTVVHKGNNSHNSTPSCPQEF